MTSGSAGEFPPRSRRHTTLLTDDRQKSSVLFELRGRVDGMANGGANGIHGWRIGESSCTKFRSENCHSTRMHSLGATATNPRPSNEPFALKESPRSPSQTLARIRPLRPALSTRIVMPIQ